MKQTDVLIIDDEKKFAGMLAKRLSLRGCSCKVHFDGQTGLDYIRENAEYISLILLDLQLPDIYGIQVLGAIKEINPALPVVIVTGHGTQSDKRQCEKIGILDFVHKPLSIEKILSYLQRLKRGMDGE